MLFVLGMLTGGSMARSGFYALLNRTLDMNFLMSVVAIGAVATERARRGHGCFLFSLGNTLQAYTMDRTRQSIRSLIKLAPKSTGAARGMEVTLPVEQITLGTSSSCVRESGWPWME